MLQTDKRGDVKGRGKKESRVSSREAEKPESFINQYPHNFNSSHENDIFKKTFNR